eukprot:scaffold203099_cov31-Tisochrysis_lutea.AAC.1
MLSDTAIHHTTLASQSESVSATAPNQSDPTIPRPSTSHSRQHATRLTPAPPGPAPQGPDSDEDDRQLDSHAIFDLSLQQAGDLVLNDTTVYAAI